MTPNITFKSMSNTRNYKRKRVFRQPILFAQNMFLKTFYNKHVNGNLYINFKTDLNIL